MLDEAASGMERGWQNKGKPYGVLMQLFQVFAPHYRVVVRILTVRQH